MNILNILPTLTPVRILDLGALQYPGEPPPYEPLLDRVACQVIGFEVLHEECERLTRLHDGDPKFTFLPLAIGDGSERMLHVCSMQSRSSLYEPNQDLCARFASFVDYIEVVERIPVRTHTLDSLPQVGDVDWVKMDIQGAELDAIRGGPRTLRSACIVQTEVKFVEQYRQQPLSGDVDCALRHLGFMFHTFLGYGTRPLLPLARADNVRAGYRQWLWADAVYLQAFDTLAHSDPEKLLKSALILHEIYQSYDFAHYSLALYDSKCGTRIACEYRHMMSEHLRLEPVYAR